MHKENPPHTHLGNANAALDPSTSCTVSLFVQYAWLCPCIWNVCACVHECITMFPRHAHVCVCLCVRKCVSLTSCTGQRKWGGTQSGPHMSVSPSGGRSLGPHRNTHTHTCTAHILYEQIDYACSSQLRSLDLLMYAPRQFYVCVRLLSERKDSERESNDVYLCLCCMMGWERERGRDIKRVTHTLSIEKERMTETGERGRLL